jgi:hypothetical protein
MVVHVGLSPQFVFRTIAAEAVLCNKAWAESERNSSYITHCRSSNRFISRRARIAQNELLKLANWEGATLIARVIEIPTLAAISIVPLRTGATIIIA